MYFIEIVTSIPLSQCVDNVDTTSTPPENLGSNPSVQNMDTVASQTASDESTEYRELKNVCDEYKVSI